MNFKKIWNFIWKEDSVWSWIVSLILAFIIVKFIIYPLIGLVLGTGFPIVAVVSESMEHDGMNFDEWWDSKGEWYEERDISKEEFFSFKFKNGFNKGDVMVLIGKESKDINIGDVVVFKSNLEYPVIHRVVEKELEDGDYYFQTKGDNNEASSNSEMKISEDRIIGKAVVRLPLLGWIKIWFSGFINLLQEVLK
jgi:signal peptidase I|tara:strand:+ start:1202 stop:1783 length:582 start_codon:yes stop_codon:yes gene_type:complete